MRADTAGGSAACDLDIRRFVAETSRMALRQVREQLGGDAIILANRSIDGGVEVLAAAPGAIDALTRRTTATSTSALPRATAPELGFGYAIAAGPEAQPQPMPVPVGRSRLASLFSRRTHSHGRSQSVAQSERATFADQTSSAGPLPRAADASSSYADIAGELAAKSGDDDIAADPSPVSVTLSRHASDAARAAAAPAMRVAAPAGVQAAVSRQPARTKLMQDLILAGFSKALSRHVQASLPDDYTDDEARVWAESILSRDLPVADDADSLIGEGGVFALVGPTGVGKTTTVAKLAAHFAMQHGSDRLALITTDGFRIGAQDQLRIYGEILGVAVHAIHDPASLTRAIAHLQDKKLVLIDTAGMSQRDERVAGQIAMLRGAKARRLVVLNAAADAETLDHVVATFADRGFAGCVITKTDEAARLGPVLDAVIRHGLRIHHVSTGQKVPEDLERPDGAALVRQALARPAARSAFDVEVEVGDTPAWRSALAARARTLEPSLDIVVATPTPPCEAARA